MGIVTEQALEEGVESALVEEVELRVDAASESIAGLRPFDRPIQGLLRPRVPLAILLGHSTTSFSLTWGRSMGITFVDALGQRESKDVRRCIDGIMLLLLLS